MMPNNLTTREGYDRLIKNLQRMSTVDRIAVANEIETARAFGDISENAEYQYAKDKQGNLEKNINDLNEYLANCEIVDVSKIRKDIVLFGACVKIINLDTEKEKTFTIVGEREIDVKNGRISYKSPLAQSLLGKKVGDDTEFTTHSGDHYYEILDLL